ncbi:MAG: response regulator [Pseudolabrys sp.]|nr:response regulator [Pseudolabrys sp.]MDP2295291.1 response regulator [Pseudolabrys sp.]
MGRAAAAPISVLLVEDEELISHLVAGELSEYGFAVYKAANADEALRYINAGGEVDVLFTDVNLPGGIDGTELAIRVRDMRPELPIVYASGRYSASGLGRMVPRSVFVPKPYRPKELCTLLSRLTAAVV